MIWISRCKCDDCDSASCNENYESCGDSDKESFEGMSNMIWVSRCKCDDCDSDVKSLEGTV